MAPDVTSHFASTCGVTDQRDIVEIQLLDESRQIVSVAVHVVPGPGLAGPTMATPVVCNHAESVLAEEHHLSVPGVRTQRPSM